MHRDIIIPHRTVEKYVFSHTQLEGSNKYGDNTICII